MRTVMTVAHLTLVEARRRRIVLAGAVCALVFLVVFSIAVVFANREMTADPTVSFIQRQATLTAVMIVGFFAANFLSVLLAIRIVSGVFPSGVTRALPLLMLEITLSLTVAVAGGARFSTVTNAIAAVGF